MDNALAFLALENYGNIQSTLKPMTSLPIEYGIHPSTVAKTVLIK